MAQNSVFLTYYVILVDRLPFNLTAKKIYLWSLFYDTLDKNEKTAGLKNKRYLDSSYALTVIAPSVKS